MRREGCWRQIELYRGGESSQGHQQAEVDPAPPVWSKDNSGTALKQGAMVGALHS